jgi:OOP family OmpA-OmpF porin
MDERDADLASLRAELLGPEQRRLAALQARLDDRLARAEDLAEVLPTVLVQHAHDPAFARALTPPLEKAITTSVRRNPKPLADALFPVMGPAIRKAVAAALSGMVDSLNRTLEHSLSWRSLRWRVEALRTGRSFGEVALLKTLLFRVEQVFLIDRRTGLLLQHVQAGGAGVQDADMVSGMLTAIRDFVHDSFRVADKDSLDALTVGDLSVWIETGPHAVLAAVIRGEAPREFRQTLQDALETIHLQFAEALESFDGDAAVFEQARPALETCLEQRFREGERRGRTRWFVALVALLLLAVVVWTFFAVWTWRRETRYLAALRAEPGLVVLSADHRRGRLVIAGLRDPLARDPATFLPDAGLSPDDVEAAWSPYYALEPSIVRARATAVLQPPAGVTIVLEGDVLRADGSPPPAWVREARRLAPLVAGAARFDAEATLAEATRAAIAALESSWIPFGSGSAVPNADEAGVLAAFVDGARRLHEIALATSRRYRLDVVGHTDDEGTEETNARLSRARADAVVAAMAPETLPLFDIVPAGVGSTAPAVAAEDASAQRRNRRVEVRVTPIPPPPGGRQP